MRGRSAPGPGPSSALDLNESQDMEPDMSAVSRKASKMKQQSGKERQLLDSSSSFPQHTRESQSQLPRIGSPPDSSSTAHIMP